MRGGRRAWVGDLLLGARPRQLYSSHLSRNALQRGGCDARDHSGEFAPPSAPPRRARVTNRLGSCLVGGAGLHRAGSRKVSCRRSPTATLTSRAPTDAVRSQSRFTYRVNRKQNEHRDNGKGTPRACVTSLASPFT